MSRRLPTGYSLRHPTLDDLGAALAVIVAADLAESGETRTDKSDLRAEWAGADLARDAWLVEDPLGRVVGYAMLSSRAGVQLIGDVYLHPDHHERGVGSAITRTIEARAAELVSLAPPNMRVSLNFYTAAPNERATALLTKEGYADVRRTREMAIVLATAPPAPIWPAGLVARPFVAGQDERAVYETISEAFDDMWGHLPRPYEDWRAHTVEHPDFDPALWAIVEGLGQPAAAICCYRFGERGHIRNLGVRRPWRRRGLGLALLRHAFNTFWARGITTIDLGVDAESLTGAMRLYERAGMRVTREFLRWEKELRPGTDLSTRALSD
jgi:mycothiol synthase